MLEAPSLGRTQQRKAAVMVEAGQAHAHPGDPGMGIDGTGIVRDPVCGMTVDPAAGKPTHEHAGGVFHLVHPDCRDKFVKTPEYYRCTEDLACGKVYNPAPP